MDQHETTTPTERKPLGRRTVLKGAAWSVPAVVAVGATPAFAATPGFSVSPFDTVQIWSGNEDTGSLTVSGTGSNGSLITVSAGGFTSGAVSVVDGEWSITIPYASFPEGILFVTAADNLGNSGTAGTVEKDTIPPTVTFGAPSNIPANKAAFTIGGTYGTSVRPNTAADDVAITAASVTAQATLANNTTVTLTQDPGTFGASNGDWSVRFTGSGNNQTIRVTATQVDSFNNSGTYTTDFDL